MKKVLAGLALILLTACNALGSGLPFTTTEELEKIAGEPTVGACHGEPVVMIPASKGGVDYWLFVTETGRGVLAQKGDDGPVYVWVVTIKDGHLTLLDGHPFSEARDGVTPCAHLFPQTS